MPQAGLGGEGKSDAFRPSGLVRHKHEKSHTKAEKKRTDEVSRHKQTPKPP